MTCEYIQLFAGTKPFVFNLFHALEDGTIPSVADKLEGSKHLESTDATGGALEMCTSPSHLEQLPGSGLYAWNEEGEEEESSDEDRNHKHRRRVSQSRSLDRSDEPDSSHFNGQPPNDLKHRATDRTRGIGHFVRERPTKYDRRSGREHAGRHFSNGDELQQNMIQGGPPIRGEAAGLRYDGMHMFRGREGAGPWGMPLRPPPFPEGPPPLLPPSSGFYPGVRAMAGRGAEWSTGFGPMSGMSSGPVEHAHRGRGLGAVGLGINMRIGRPRCLDFEERGFCLRGDLCPMEHGANRIVVEDVQSLSKFNLPVTLPNGRGMSMGSGPLTVSSALMLPSTQATGSRGAPASREPGVPPIGEVPVPANEADLYDPDQPLWNKDRIEASGMITKLPSFRKRPQEQGQEGDAGSKDKTDRASEAVSRGATDGGIHGIDVGSTVWDRIGPVDRGAEGRLHEKDTIEDQQVQSRGHGLWPGKWERKEETLHVHTVTGHGQGSSAQGEVGLAVQRAKDGSSIGSQSTVARGSGSERAQQTLYVSCIPPTSNKAEVLLLHFEKFGQVVDVRIPPHSDRAFVQFASREAAESALASPDAVMGNRFIRLSWANRDSISNGNVGPVPITAHLIPLRSEPTAAHSVHTSKGRGKHGLVMLNGTGASYVPETLAIEGVGQVATSRGSISSVAATGGIVQKKQEELEMMREKIRQKQEALAKKRDDFRRKLDRLANQVNCPPCCCIVSSSQHYNDRAQSRKVAVHSDFDL
jgi:RNA-binding protein 26